VVDRLDADGDVALAGVPAKLGDDAGIVGGAVLARRETK